MSRENEIEKSKLAGKLSAMETIKELAVTEEKRQAKQAVD